ncbi:MAG TPA: hypothetical protein VFQ73_12375 [Flavisolibacter sp.]|nr:hypothetical protein [Flavisolibacter sp.]
MKAVVFVMIATLLTSFSIKQEVGLGGIWTGVYRSDNVREKVLVKFDAQNGVELYNGEVVENNRYTGTWELQGDTVLVFKYVASDGKEFTMHGHINKRKNYVDGVWQTSDKLHGSFYLKKEKIQEMYVQP